MVRGLLEIAHVLSSGAPADDCDPFAIQNYIDRLAAEVYDSLNPPPKDSLKTAEDKDEWELMKEKAKMVPFQDVTLSIALKHGLMDEVKKENANKSFDKDSILSIMRVRDEFLRDYADANAFEYQWQVCILPSSTLHFNTFSTTHRYPSPYMIIHSNTTHTHIFTYSLIQLNHNHSISYSPTLMSFSCTTYYTTLLIHSSLTCY